MVMKNAVNKSDQFASTYNINHPQGLLGAPTSSNGVPPKKHGISQRSKLSMLSGSGGLGCQQNQRAAKLIMKGSGFGELVGGGYAPKPSGSRALRMLSYAGKMQQKKGLNLRTAAFKNSRELGWGSTMGVNEAGVPYALSTKKYAPYV